MRSLAEIEEMMAERGYPRPVEPPAPRSSSVRKAKTKSKDKDDRHITGTLPDDPSADSTPMGDERYTLESGIDIARPVPPPDPLCRGLALWRGSLAMVGGYGYSRKTLFGQDVALSVASGKSALGVYSVACGPVLHIDYEQGRRITDDRYQRIARAKGIDLASVPLHKITFPKVYLTSRDAEQWIAKVYELVKPVLVIVDSLRAACPGIDENDSRIREYLDMLGRQSKTSNACTIVIHHARKAADGKPAGKYSLRGSAAIFDALDSAFVFGAEKGERTDVSHEKDRVVGTEIESFAIDSHDIPNGTNPRWGLQVVHVDAEQIKEQQAAREVHAHAVATATAEERVRAKMTALPGGTWQGSRRTLAQHVGGRYAVTLSTITSLISTGAIVEGKKELRWVGQ